MEPLPVCDGRTASRRDATRPGVSVREPAVARFPATLRPRRLTRRAPEL